MSSTLWLTVSTFILATLADTSPRQVLWSDKTIGPDGPWHAVKTKIGGKEISLFPGTNWESWVIEDDYCGDGTCYASEAGTHNRNTSGKTGDINLPGDFKYFVEGVDVEGDNPMRYVDDVEINGITITNASLSLMNSTNQKIKYPGKTSPFFAGCLSVGSRGDAYQTFDSLKPNAPRVITSMPPGFLWDRGYTASNSFGLHIGSASAQSNIPGSLWYGGYDLNRVAGERVYNEGDFKDATTVLRDISIDVIGGKSPFDFNSSKTGLLADGNSNLPNEFKVMVDGCSPYLTLPSITCDNIAKNLPVTFNQTLGLYLWNTSSEKYREIVPSAAALSFSLNSSGSSNPIKIRVPFMHLNLTLTSPLVDTPTQYFPCHVNGGDRYVLGRAFLQDAFLGGNWGNDKKKWWLAQAPGPNIPASSNVVQIESSDTTIRQGETTWEDSWKGVWNDATQSGSPGDNESNRGGGAGGAGGLSTGAKAGIVVGVAIAGLLLLVGAFFLWKRHRQSKSQSQGESQPAPQDNDQKAPGLQPPAYDSNMSWASPSPSQTPSELGGSRFTPSELHGSRSIPSELQTSDRVHEMP